MTIHLWEFEKEPPLLRSTITLALNQVPGGKENKAVLSGNLKAEPNTAGLQKILVENVSSIAACGCSTQSSVRPPWERKATPVHCYSITEKNIKRKIRVM